MYSVNHAWLYGSVKPYFEKQGIRLLKDDMLFIEKCLSNIPSDRHRMVMRDYLNLFKPTIVNNENIASSWINARFEANSYLRNISQEREESVLD